MPKATRTRVNFGRPMPPMTPSTASGTARSWMAEEDERLIAAIEEHGSSWRKVAVQVGGGRTEAMCRNRHQRMQQVNQEDFKGRNRCTACGEIKRGHSCQATLRPSPLTGHALFSDTLRVQEIELPRILGVKALDDDQVTDDEDALDEASWETSATHGILEGPMLPSLKPNANARASSAAEALAPPLSPPAVELSEVHLRLGGVDKLSGGREAEADRSEGSVRLPSPIWLGSEASPSGLTAPAAEDAPLLSGSMAAPRAPVTSSSIALPPVPAPPTLTQTYSFLAEALFPDGGPALRSSKPLSEFQSFELPSRIFDDAELQRPSSPLPCVKFSSPSFAFSSLDDDAF